MTYREIMGVDRFHKEGSKSGHVIDNLATYALW